MHMSMPNIAYYDWKERYFNYNKIPLPSPLSCDNCSAILDFLIASPKILEKEKKYQNYFHCQFRTWLTATHEQSKYEGYVRTMASQQPVRTAMLENERKIINKVHVDCIWINPKIRVIKKALKKSKKLVYEFNKIYGILVQMINSIQEIKSRHDELLEKPDLDLMTIDLTEDVYDLSKRAPARGKIIVHSREVHPSNKE